MYIQDFWEISFPVYDFSFHLMVFAKFKRFKHLYILTRTPLKHFIQTEAIEIKLAQGK